MKEEKLSKDSDWIEYDFHRKDNSYNYPRKHQRTPQNLINIQQAWFRSRSSYADHINTLRNILDQCWKFKSLSQGEQDQKYQKNFEEGEVVIRNLRSTNHLLRFVSDQSGQKVNGKSNIDS